MPRLNGSEFDGPLEDHDVETGVEDGRRWAGMRQGDAWCDDGIRPE